MKIDKAIKHLGDCMSETEKILWPEVWESHKLGIEALKREQYHRTCYPNQSPNLLPSETTE